MNYKTNDMTLHDRSEFFIKDLNSQEYVDLAYKNGFKTPTEKELSKEIERLLKYIENGEQAEDLEYRALVLMCSDHFKKLGFQPAYGFTDDDMENGFMRFALRYQKGE